ncbi:hypothetical protein [Streptomyces sp. MB09-02B]|uniref:hypothetical protein n=1 Tax=Streptomyces sp. MB09-02B TaxID=3028667 RepID=UPI0029A934E3|nr:hypothetical protein [Streptomyces sp. MB09-02B]MDX3639097.1 hypothetical protein [Streptomyces sp. MB09-02B]
MHQLVESPVAQFADTEIGDRVGLLAAPGEPTLCAVLATVTFGAAGAALEATLDGVFVVAAGAATATAVAAATEGTACGGVDKPLPSDPSHPLE